MKTSEIRIPREAFAGIVPLENGDFDLQLRDGFYIEDYLSQPSWLGDDVRMVDERHVQFGGEVAKLSAKRALFVACVLLRGGRADHLDIALAVWDDSTKAGGTVRDLMREINNQLAQYDHPPCFVSDDETVEILWEK